MARGWESKSVEEQQNQAVQAPTTKDPRKVAHQKADGLRQVQALKLTRARICEQLERSGNERYNDLLNKELQHIDVQLKVLEDSL